MFRIDIYIYTYTYLHAYIHVHMHTYTYIYPYTYLYMCIFEQHVRRNLDTHTNMNINRFGFAPPRDLDFPVVGTRISF